MGGLIFSFISWPPLLYLSAKIISRVEFYKFIANGLPVITRYVKFKFCKTAGIKSVSSSTALKAK